MTPDRPTGPATAAEFLAKAVLLWGPEKEPGAAKRWGEIMAAEVQSAERARILAALPEALLMVDEAEILRIGNGGEPTQTTEEYAAALAAAIERVLGKDRG